ncbi:hypothetical protein PC116_g18382 [Phytophthora cactorum]|uniref:Uncharacterized protein n=1 Tax=Phytophthora cactorum TaxID=29920 RepID=A0A8T1B8Q7_9STRA|nr:hypothetical protein PC112_g17958 [Phytophthora cactorum]KAG2815131.1 hypothetical protein PC111_g13693 [Phytophthora cactorum]KAG2853031.1 hypothetical protein PC113_g14519 [Phytophthora cactorum]KAG2885742.1 hypothetical protein PC114_g19555 [Phytophthora cactorum]KAG2896176.1 hypothetical protein PC115_g17584 [Phytophthora cactorum]
MVWKLSGNRYKRQSSAQNVLFHGVCISGLVLFQTMSDPTISVSIGNCSTSGHYSVANDRGDVYRDHEHFKGLAFRD